MKKLVTLLLAAGMVFSAANAAVAGADSEGVRRIMDCFSTDDALDVINEEDLIPKVSELLLEKIEYHMNHRTWGAIRTAAVMFSSVYGPLGRTSLADELLDDVRTESE